MSSPIRALICDDHPLFRDGLRSLLCGTDDIEVVDEATTGEAAVELALRLEPDVVMMDINMPGISGIEATRRIIEHSPKQRVLMVTMFDDDSSVFTAMRAGARGYVLKDAGKEDMLGAVRGVARGGAVFSPGVARQVIDFFARDRPAVAREAFPELTGRERELLHLMAQGTPNAEIARLLELTPKTVANYVSSILTKLQVANRASAIQKVRDAGLS